MKINRRKFFKFNLLSIFILQALKYSHSKAILLNIKQAKAQDSTKLKFVTDKDPVAKALGYNENSKKVNSSLKIEKDGTPGKNQFCSNCALYLVDKSIPGGGKCKILTSGYVKSQGWCKSWGLKKTS